jgi:hypothetical protein
VLRFLSDEDFDGDILDGIVRRMPDLDIVRVQDVGLAGQEDPVILAWAGQNDRIFFTHDRRTMTAHANSHLKAGLRVAGVCIVRQLLPIGQAIDELLLIVQCSRREGWEGQVRYVPL